MSANDSKDKDEATMLMAMNQLAEKYGCTVKVDFKTHTIDFDCPDKESEQNLAFEIKGILEGTN